MVDERLLERLRESLSKTDNVAEKKMFGGICFMVDDKMCICARNDELMCRVGPDQFEKAIAKKGCRPMVHNGRPMLGFVFVNAEAIKTRAALNPWISMCLAYNKEARPSKKPSPKKKRTLQPKSKIPNVHR
ncbi:MAG: TfoX/Sxy family protein [Spirochaetia bacterium]|nr:TfoX/Sxy family protein [Spirochaetia bacterium]